MVARRGVRRWAASAVRRAAGVGLPGGRVLEGQRDAAWLCQGG